MARVVTVNSPGCGIETACAWIGDTMTKSTWLVTVAVRGQEKISGIDADRLLRRNDLGGVVGGHGFGPGAVDLELNVEAHTADEASATVRQRVADVLGPDWLLDVGAGMPSTDAAN